MPKDKRPALRRSITPSIPLKLDLHDAEGEFTAEFKLCLENGSMVRFEEKSGVNTLAQALMDLGATICTPRRPRCVLCPWHAFCAGAAAGIEGDVSAMLELTVTKGSKSSAPTLPTKTPNRFTKPCGMRTSLRSLRSAASS